MQSAGNQARLSAGNQSAGNQARLSAGNQSAGNQARLSAGNHPVSERAANPVRERAVNPVRERAANPARQLIFQGGDCLHSGSHPPQSVAMTTAHWCKQNKCPS